MCPLTSQNWLLHGRKRWVLFPPSVPAAEIGIETKCKGEADGEEEEGAKRAKGAEGTSHYDKLVATGAGYWWERVFPGLKARAAELGMVECYQEEGEMMYVPQGWWHAVLNVSDWSVIYNLFN